MIRRAVPDGWERVAADCGAKARAALDRSIVPFWWRAIDRDRGGVFNCIDNTGTRRVSRDKFTWSQGRFAWLLARLAEAARRGWVAGDAGQFLSHAGRTVDFLRSHAFLADGRCAFLLSEEGAVKEAIAGRGPAPSIYADCFVAMGLAEFARVAGEGGVRDEAIRTWDGIARRLEEGGVPTWPEPVPDGYVSHGLAMIFLNVTLVLHRACEEGRDPRAGQVWEAALGAAARIFDQFMAPGGRIAELRPASGATGSAATLLDRHLNPGHALEGLWMLLTVAVRAGREDWLNRAGEAVRFAFARGWDERHGGLLHYVDCDGGPPRGEAGESLYEGGVRATWDTKLWWVHSEALLAALASWRWTGDDVARAWLERTWEYAFRVFPHPDPSVGEWIQIRDRQGRPLDRVVALPVKDPYHIARNLIQVVEMQAEPHSLRLP